MPPSSPPTPRSPKRLPAITVLATLLTLAGASSSHAGSNLEGMDFSHWMRDLPDETRLCDLSIPGTHDTLCTPGASGKTGYSTWAQTQSWDLATQFERGIRHLDIRVQKAYDVFQNRWKFRVVHGEDIVYHVGYFGKDVLDVCKDFLKTHPGETVIMLISHETSPVNDNTGVPASGAPSLSSIVDRYISENKWKNFVWRPSADDYVDPAKQVPDDRNDNDIPDKVENVTGADGKEIKDANGDTTPLFPDAKWNDPQFPSLGTARGKIIIVHKGGKYGGGVGKRWYAESTGTKRWFGPMSGGDHYKGGGGPASKSRSTVWLNGRAFLRGVVDPEFESGTSSSGKLRRTGLNGQALDALGLPYPDDAANYIQPRLFNLLFSGDGQGFGSPANREIDPKEPHLDANGPDWLHNLHTGVLHMDYPRKRAVAAQLAHNFHLYPDPMDIMRNFRVPGLRYTTLLSESVAGMWLSHNMFENGETCTERATATRKFLEHVLPDFDFSVFCLKKGDDRSKFGLSATTPKVGIDWKGLLHAGFVGDPIVVSDHNSRVAVTGLPAGSNASAYTTANNLRSTVLDFVNNHMQQSLDPQDQAEAIRDHLAGEFPPKPNSAAYWGVVVDRDNDTENIGSRMRGTSTVATATVGGKSHRYFVWGAAGPRFPVTVTDTTVWGSGSLRTAIHQALPGDTITFDPSLSGRSISLGTSDIDIEKNLTIDASDLPGGITLNGGGTFRAFHIKPGSRLRLTGMTLVNGSASNGGAVHNEGTLILSSCTLRNNHATGNGGAIYNKGSLTVRDSTIHKNTANNGGSIESNGSAASARIISSTLYDNTAATAGGGFNNSGGASATLVHTTVTGNSATGARGGGIRNSGGTVSIENCIVAGNTATANPNIRFTVTRLSNNLVGGDPGLTPLGDYGGPTKTMPPLATSPAVDAAVDIAGHNNDQRGISRSTGAAPDLGSTEHVPLVVTSLREGSGSLRWTIDQADPGDSITFDPDLAGGTMSIAAPIVIDKDITIDASALPGGFTISGSDLSRVLSVPTAGNPQVTLKNITVTRGNSGAGTGISNAGTLTLTDCTVSRNNASHNGAGVYNTGSLTVERCTFHNNNTTHAGGAINSRGAGATLTVTNSTFARNLANRGGAISTAGGATTIVTHSTLTSNSANLSGGGLRNIGATTTLSNSIVANNHAPDTPEIEGTINQPSPNLTTGHPRLANLGDYGGPTWTMPPLPASPAIDAADNASALPHDQRGQPRPSGPSPDLGATEYQGAIDLEHYWTRDFNADGQTFGTEFASGTDPLAIPGSAPPPMLPSVISDSAAPGIAFGMNPDAAPLTTWIVCRSNTLDPDSFVEIFRYNGSDGTSVIHPDFTVVEEAGTLRVIDNTSPPPASTFYKVSTELVP